MNASKIVVITRVQPAFQIGVIVWHARMREAVAEAEGILKRSGSLVVVLQPNSEKVGNIRLWL
jgi:hypothetical protein